jgi:hypothetical protein
VIVHCSGVPGEEVGQAGVPVPSAIGPKPRFPTLPEMLAVADERRSGRDAAQTNGTSAG